MLGTTAQACPEGSPRGCPAAPVVSGRAAASFPAFCHPERGSAFVALRKGQPQSKNPYRQHVILAVGSSPERNHAEPGLLSAPIPRRGGPPFAFLAKGGDFQSAISPNPVAD